jgi:hypothetical protein
VTACAADLPKDKQDIFALVEFKRGWIGDDRDRVLILLKHIHTCRYGIVCGWLGQANRDACYDNCVAAQDRWFEHPFHFDGVPYFFCACLLERAQ